MSLHQHLLLLHLWPRRRPQHRWLPRLGSLPLLLLLLLLPLPSPPLLSPPVLAVLVAALVGVPMVT